MASKGGFVTVPCGDKTFIPHDCFRARERNAFYSLDLVQPVVHPYSLWGPLQDSPWYNFWSVFPSRQWSAIEDYIKIYAISGEHYDPFDTDKRLPKEHRQFTVCAECGRQAQDCWAMASLVNFNPPFDQPSYVACVYCSTYRALVAFMDTHVKWFDALQLPNVDEERERVLKGLNTMLAWLQEAIVTSVQWYKKGHYGRLPPKMRRLYYKATVEGCGFVTTPSTMQADYEHMVPGMAPYDFDLNHHLGCDPASMDA